jgi:hypothetical protein
MQDAAEMADLAAGVATEGVVEVAEGAADLGAAATMEESSANLSDASGTDTE